MPPRQRIIWIVGEADGAPAIYSLSDQAAVLVVGAADRMPQMPQRPLHLQRFSESSSKLRRAAPNYDGCSTEQTWVRLQTCCYGSQSRVLTRYHLSMKSGRPSIL